MGLDESIPNLKTRLIEKFTERQCWFKVMKYFLVFMQN